MILDGKVFRTDRCADTTTSATGTTIHSWYSGKHWAFGGNVQAIMRPNGQPIWTSDVVAGPDHDHDLTAVRDAHLLGVLYLGGIAAEPAHPRRRRLPRRRQGHPRPVQATGQRERPHGRPPGLQRPSAWPTRPRGTRLRPADHPLACPATHHRPPIQNRRHRRRRTDTHPIRTTRPTPI